MHPLPVPSFFCFLRYSVLLLLLLLLLSPQFSLRSSSAGSQNSTGLTHQALLIHCAAKNFLTIRHVLCISAFCVTIYRARRRLYSFKISCNFFRTITVVESTVGIIQGVFTCHTLISYYVIIIIIIIITIIIIIIILVNHVYAGYLQ